jgi:hypothetical protein
MYYNFQVKKNIRVVAIILIEENRFYIFSYLYIIFVCLMLYLLLKVGVDIQNAPGGKVNILGGHSIGHSKKEC